MVSAIEKCRATIGLIDSKRAYPNPSNNERVAR